MKFGDFLEEFDYKGRTIFWFAIKRNNLDMINLILANASSINIFDRMTIDGEKPIVFLKHTFDPEILDLVLNSYEALTEKEYIIKQKKQFGNSTPTELLMLQWKLRKKTKISKQKNIIIYPYSFNELSPWCTKRRHSITVMEKQLVKVKKSHMSEVNKVRQSRRLFFKRQKLVPDL